VNEIIRAAERGATLVRQLLAFSRKQEYAPAVVDLNQILDDLGGLLRRLIGEAVELVVIPAPTPVLVKADPNQLELVTINLVTNARDAMAGGRGTLTIEVGRTTVGDAAPPTVGRLEPGDYAVLAVSDTGHGVDATTAARMFDPFFTTKEVGKGTGLGLAAVLGVAAQGGGSIGVTSDPGRGSTISVYLPVTHEAPSAAAADDLLPDPRGDETILVVEDDEAVATMMTAALRTRGYRVIVAANGHQALALWEHYGAQVDLVLSDVVMPAVSGPELVARLHAAGHQPRVLFVSGYTANALAALDHLALEVDLLEKPFSARELGRRVRRALDR
jgi:CheY-like chemotaxis protein